MIADLWLVKAFVVVQGNRITRGQGAGDLCPFEAALGTGLRAGSASAVWFEASGGGRLPFAPWLEGLRAEGLRSIALVPAVPELAPTLLALELRPGGRRLYGDRWERCSAPLPAARALLAFVREHPDEGLAARTAHYAQELGLVQRSDWAEVEQGCDPGADELWVQAFQLAVSHVEVSARSAAAWEALLSRRAPSRRSPPTLVFTEEPPTAEAAGPRQAATVEAARAALEAALRENLALAQAGGWSTWIAWFTEALALLVAPPEPDDPWVQATAGCGVPAEVLSLARAADKSHVFGGMGSWNDVPVDNGAQRERLWEAMHAAWGAVFAALTARATGA